MRRFLIALGVAVTSSSFASLAHAHDPAGARSSEPAGAEKKSEEAETEEEPKWEVTIDVVGGAATLPVLNGGSPSLIEAPKNNQFDSTRITVFTALIGLEHNFGEHWTVGARLPVEQAFLDTRTGNALNRDYLIAGNLELEGAYKLPLSKMFELDFSLGLALPTGGGEESPSDAEVEANVGKTYEYTRIDRGAVARAASMVRGGYESALFEPGRIGFIPRVAAKISVGNLAIRPMVKAENLVDVTGDAEHGYLGELVAGLRVSYKIIPQVEPGVSVWTNITYTTTEETNTTVGVVEPFLRFPLGQVTPMVGAIIPFAGYLVDDKAFGVRVSVAGEF